MKKILLLTFFKDLAFFETANGHIWPFYFFGPVNPAHLDMWASKRGGRGSGVRGREKDDFSNIWRSIEKFI